MYQNLEAAFSQGNSLIYRSKTSNSFNKIFMIKGPQKNLQLKIILLSRRPLIKTKKGTISQFLVADDSGAAYMNFFDQFGESLQEGDILYLSGVYTSYHKQSLILFQGSQSIIKIIGKWIMKFITQPNISLKDLNPTKNPPNKNNPKNEQSPNGEIIKITINQQQQQNQ